MIGQPLAGLSASEGLDWVFKWGAIGLVKICGVDAASAQAVIDACGKVANHPGLITLADLKLDNDAIVIATPEIAGLPYVVSGLVAAGGLAAALSTADGLLLAIANALSHDVYYKMLDPNAPTARRLIVARVLLVCVAVVGAYTASFRPADIVAMVAWAFSLAAGGLFPALVLGIWWKRTTSAGAVCGIAAGFGITLLYLVVTRYYPVFGVEWLGMSSLLNPVTGAPVVDVAAALGGDPADGLQDARLEGRVVQHQQHLLGDLRAAARHRRHDRREPAHAGAEPRDAGLHRRGPASARRDDDEGKGGLSRRPAATGAGHRPALRISRRRGYERGR